MNSKDLIKRAEEMESDARKLRQAAEILGYSTVAKPQPPPGKTRAEQLAAFIQAHDGAATRQEIVSESGIPPGTVASLLGTKKKFYKDSRGFWHPKKAEVQAEPMVAQA